MSEIFLLPGRLATLSGPGVIRTVLGSCVAIVLYDPVLALGGVNHYLLPEPSARELGGNRLKYGIVAIPELVQSVLELGAQRSRLCAQIYGGAAVINQLLGNLSIGERNINLAEDSLARLKIAVVGRDIGGQQGRKITFRLPLCQTEVKFIPSFATGS